MPRHILPSLVAAFLTCAPTADAQNTPAAIAAKTAGLQKIDGFVPLYWDEGGGKMLMQIGRFDTELLYQISLPAGVGSNAIGLDRGQLGDTHVVRFERVGPKVLLVEPNYRYRARSNNPGERRAVEDSFAQSILWGFKTEAAEAGSVLVDATSFFMRDAHGVVDRLRQTKQGRYRLDESRSAFYLSRTKGFPKNTEIEAVLTFTTDEDPGRLVSQTTPTAQAVTVRQHHSFVELPDPAGYKPRRLDPRVGVFGIEFYDYATPITEPVEQRWISRHRLHKKDPSAPVSEATAPMVYYVDNGAPEPIRTALMDGASWWSEAFEAAGFRNAFQVKVLPDDADPMDIRYNMINWVHRSTRGWSYGGGVTDPRTGEIIKGNVTLGSLRVRQDYLLGSGLVPPFTSEDGGRGAAPLNPGCELADIPDAPYLADLDPSIDAAAMALARIRQLSAHEVGHSLGFAHNFAASTYGRASVMDYPAPMVEITGDRLDLSNAYARGVGVYDRFAARYAYSQFAPGADEPAELERIVREGVAGGMLFISDEDARPAGAAHPLANLWDNGSDPVERLRHEMKVRSLGLSRFGLESIPSGTPLSMLEAKLLPLFLHHRYQVQAAVKSVGGVHYTYAVKTEGGSNPATVREIVPPARQKEALRGVLDTLRPSELVVPERILGLLPPRAFGYGGGTTELFFKRTDPVFDPIGAATIAADFAISGLLQMERAARLVEFHARDRRNPGFDEVVDALIASTWRTPAPAEGYPAAVQRAIQTLTVTRLIDLAANEAASPEVRAIATDALRGLNVALRAAPPAAKVVAAHRRATRDDIERFLARPEGTHKRTAPLPTPAGDPIGSRQ
ncbi:MAG: zinc-dependent metalloprotease [Acidobacteria bacterium]|nr:zinc-dependent metalloprotease [Acidobacteriota bacterium]